MEFSLHDSRHIEEIRLRDVQAKKNEKSWPILWPKFNVFHYLKKLDIECCTFPNCCPIFWIPKDFFQSLEETQVGEISLKCKNVSMTATDFYPNSTIMRFSDFSSLFVENSTLRNLTIDSPFSMSV